MFFRSISLATLCIALNIITPPASAQPVYEFKNGHWYSDGSFVASTFYSQHGVLTETRPARVDSVIDLDGKWVIPPLAEGHIHDLNVLDSIDERLADYESKGIQ